MWIATNNRERTFKHHLWNIATDLCNWRIQNTVRSILLQESLCDLPKHQIRNYPCTVFLSLCIHSCTASKYTSAFPPMHQEAVTRRINRTNGQMSRNKNTSEQYLVGTLVFSNLLAYHKDFWVSWHLLIKSRIQSLSNCDLYSTTKCPQYMC